MNRERDKICRQVASLFGLTTSSVIGEREAAKDKVKELVKKHKLSFAEVGPHAAGNEIALRVMKSFWSIAADTPAPASDPSQGGWRGRQTQPSQADDNQFIYEQLFRAAGVPRWTGGYDWGRYGAGTDHEPTEQRHPNDRIFVVWQGMELSISKLSDVALHVLIEQCQDQDRRERPFQEHAQHLIDIKDYLAAAEVLETLQQALRPPAYKYFNQLRVEKSRRESGRGGVVF